MNDMTIDGIYGLEPMREGEYPIYYKLGVNDVTKIEFEECVYGDHGIGQFHIYKGDKLVSTVMHRALAEIVYV
jgi:hypothetical protein